MSQIIKVNTLLKKYQFAFLGILLIFATVFVNAYIVRKPKNADVSLGAIPGDANGDGRVDILDFQLLSNSFGKDPGQTGYDGRCDFNSSNTVDILDFQLLSNNFGQVNATQTPSPRVTASPTSSTGPTYDQVLSWVLAYKAAHPGNGGKDWDINAKTDAQIAADPAALQLMSVCGDYRIIRPVYPLIAWEYGGTDHPWVHPELAALLYCTYIPYKPYSSHWTYDLATNNVTADTFVKFPDQNPCKNETGANQLISCLGNPADANDEIIVDTASLRDGHDVGLELSLSTSKIYLILLNGSKVLAINNI